MTGREEENMGLNIKIAAEIEGPKERDRVQVFLQAISEN